MPIRPENAARYPADWPAVSARIRFGRAAGRCECTGECRTGHGGRCAAVHGMPHPDTGSDVVLTTAHRNHQPEDCSDGNLFAACQRCHLGYDRDHHAETAALRRAAGLAQAMDPLFTVEEVSRAAGG